MPQSRSGKPATAKALLIGLSSGALLAANWRSVLKAGIKAGATVGVKLQTLAVRGAENVADLTHEARSEMHAALREKQAQQAAAAAQEATAGAAGDSRVGA